MKKLLSFVAIAALGTLMSCSGGSPSAPAVPTPAADTWAITSITASDSQPVVGETVTITVTVTKNGQAAPDGTAVSVRVASPAVLFNCSTGDVASGFTSGQVQTSGGTATICLYSETEGTYAVTAQVGSVQAAVNVAYQQPTISSDLQIYSVVPSEGSLEGGELVLVNGTGMYPPVQVTFTVEGAPYMAEVIALDPDAQWIQLRTPAPAGLDPAQEHFADLTVIRGKGTTYEQTQIMPNAFRYRQATGEPEIYSLYPAQGSSRGGDQVTVYGRNFAAPVQVTFTTDLGTVEADEVSLSADGTQISLVTPPLSAQPVQGDHPADVTVRTAVGTANEKAATKPNGFVFLADHPEPQITGVSPSSGPMEGGTRVTIFGTGFEFPVQVMFGTREANVIDVSYDEIVCLSPDYTPTGLTPPVTVDVSVRNIASGLTSTLPGAFTYGESMFISGNSPSEGPPSGGTQVTIFGSGFRAPLAVEWIPDQGSAGAVPAQVVSVSGNQIVIVTGAADPVPCDDSAGLFRVTQLDSGVSVEGGAFTYGGQNLTIYALTPSSGASGTPVTVTGNNFAVADASEAVRVTFDDLQPQIATFPDPNDLNTIQVTVPDTTPFEFDTVDCVGDQGATGCQQVSSPVDVTVENLATGCADTLANGFGLEPTNAACRELIVATDSNFHDFGNVPVNTAATWSFDLQNNGTAEDLTFNWTATAPDGFTLSPASGGVAPGSSVAINVTFAPTIAQPYGGAIVITATSGACTVQGTASVTVQGTGQ